MTDRNTNTKGNTMAEMQTRGEILRQAAQSVVGRSVLSADAAKILDAYDWAQHYPVADGVRGKYTGEVVESDATGWVVVGNAYAVRGHYDEYGDPVYGD